MASYRLRTRADTQLVEIYHYSIAQFGESQADSYLMNLEQRFQDIADNPKLGRPMDQFRTGVRRNVCQQHAIYYKIDPDGVVAIMAIVGRQDPARLIDWLRDA